MASIIALNVNDMTRAEEQALKAYPNINIGEQHIDQSPAREVYVQGYEQAISDISTLVIGEKMKQGVDVSKATEAIKGIDLSSIVNAINNSKR